MRLLCRSCPEQLATLSSRLLWWVPKCAPVKGQTYCRACRTLNGATLDAPLIVPVDRYWCVLCSGVISHTASTSYPTWAAECSLVYIQYHEQRADAAAKRKRVLPHAPAQQGPCTSPVPTLAARAAAQTPCHRAQQMPAHVSAANAAAGGLQLPRFLVRAAQTPAHPCGAAVCRQPLTALAAAPHRLLGPEHHNHARLSEPVLQQLLELPMTRGLMDFRDRVDDMSTWKLALQKGCGPWRQEGGARAAAVCLQQQQPAIPAAHSRVQWAGDASHPQGVSTAPPLRHPPAPCSRCHGQQSICCTWHASSSRSSSGTSSKRSSSRHVP